MSRGQHPHRLSQGLTPRLIKFMEVKKNISLAEHTTFKIGGKAKFFIETKNRQNIIEAVKFAQKNNLPFFVLGGGANMLFLDDGYDGLVIKIQNSKFKVLNSNITAEAGILLRDVVGKAADASLSGLEWAAGIPGSFGGAIRGNAQAFGENIAGNLEEVEFLDSSNLKVKKIKKKDCNYSEKNSLFKENSNLIILSAVLKLKKGKKEKIEKKMEKNLNDRKEKQPLGRPSAGSVFINEEGRESSSALIEKAGLKGRKIGQVMVSKKHAGFIVNLGRASAKDVLELIKIIKKEVKNKFNINLKEEIQII